MGNLTTKTTSPLHKSTVGKAPVIKNPSPTVLVRDTSILHPVFRKCLEEVLIQLHQDKLPFEVFESYRSPARQAYLYSQGRSLPGKVVTQARAWQSYHQYGLATDLVLLIDGKWTWDASGDYHSCWEQLREVGEFYGLEGLSFEQPHLQLAGLHLHELHQGIFPGGGDSAWWDNLTLNAAAWKGNPPAPEIGSPLPSPLTAPEEQ
jgi:peptidoglycan LD-endopeptidase CwlK